MLDLGAKQRQDAVESKRREGVRNAKERKKRIAELNAQITELENEDSAAEFFDKPLYKNAINGLKDAIVYQERMLKGG